ncbi:MAG: hypothetical protein ACOCRX_03055 [Candidatus Woesearchaeota archaeon]
MNKDCKNCPNKNDNKNKYIIKYRVSVTEIGDYNKDELEKRLNNEKGIIDAIIKEDELIIDYDDILISPAKIKEILD